MTIPYPCMCGDTCCSACYPAGDSEEINDDFYDPDFEDLEGEEIINNEEEV